MSQGKPALLPDTPAENTHWLCALAGEMMREPCASLPMSKDDAEAETFKYEGYDIITLEKEFERDYTIPPPQTPQEVIGYYARRIAQDLRLPSQFAALAPKVREFLETRAFVRPVDLEDRRVFDAICTTAAHYVTVRTFVKALRSLTIQEAAPELLTAARFLSHTPPFPWSGPTFEATRTVFNLVACDNDFELRFAKFLHSAPDVARFARLAMPVGFAIDYTDPAMNLRLYYPDFVAVDDQGVHWLIETKGQENVDVVCKDRAAKQWCENATELTGTPWRYMKVMQVEFDQFHPPTLAQLQVIAADDPTLFEEE